MARSRPRLREHQLGGIAALCLVGTARAIRLVGSPRAALVALVRDQSEAKAGTERTLRVLEIPFYQRERASNLPILHRGKRDREPCRLVDILIRFPEIIVDSHAHHFLWYELELDIAPLVRLDESG